MKRFFCNFAKNYRVMYYQRLSDEEILSGFREGDADIIREYFYGYCQVGYNIFDQRYQLREKENLDFMSLAHQYAIYLMEHNWKPLEDHSPEVMDERAIVMSEAMMEEALMGMPAPMAYEDMRMSKTEPDMEQKRTTPEFITELQPGEIFVFGSNLKGMHGGGAAYIAYRKFGAIMGQGVGLQGQSYAIPTMQGGVETIKPYVDEFIQFAKEHQELTFLVTRIGCGIAGFTDKEISPLFEKAHDVENIVLPLGW